jgi:pimeloyl-ACP methyl ester carboxylesterase
MERFTSFDGTGIAYSDTGSGPAVLLLHGHAAHQALNWQWPGVVGALVGAGRRVVTVDQRGHGSSDKPYEPSAYEDEAMRRDAQALLDHLGIESVDVVGYSMGSLVAAQLTLADPRVRSLLLGGAGMPGETGRDTRMSSEDEEVVYAADDPASITNPDALRLRHLIDLMGADRRALLALQRARPPEVPRIDTIAVPTLILTGEDDDVVGSPQVLASLIPGAEVIRIPGDHLTALTDPGFRANIVGFLAEVLPVEQSAGELVD